MLALDASIFFAAPKKIVVSSTTMMRIEREL
jgi:hypothetical protein